MTWSSPADQSHAAELLPESWTIQRVLTWSTGWLRQKGADKDATSHRLEAELLLSKVLGCDRMQLFLQLDKPLSREERENFKVFLRRRAEGEPVCYILGIKHFYRHVFKVSEAVLIPRADTEVLVERSLELLSACQSPKVLDVGTGSGCIAISIALEVPHAAVVAWDKSKEALAVARQNSLDLNSINVTWFEQDLFSAVDAGPFDLIVSNPPYIAWSEFNSLSVSVRDYEPAEALFDETDGLTFYRTLAKKSDEWLCPGGALVVECGHTQAAAVIQIFSEHNLQQIFVTNDLAGMQRVVSGRRSPV